MASWFTRALDVLTPWDRGGEIQRRQERRRKEEEDAQARANFYNRQSAPSQRSFNQPQNAPQFQQAPKPQQPVNIFEGLNKNLVFNKPQTTVSVMDTREDLVSPPKPGDIVRPQQTLLDKVRDQFDANTEADKYRRQQGNRTKGEDKPIILDRPGNIISKTPFVGTAVKMLNTLGNQDRELRETLRGVVASRTNNAGAYRASAQRQDELRRNYMKNKGGLFNVGTLYDEESAARGDIKTGAKDILAPSAVSVLDLYTLGKGSAISEAVEQGGIRSGITTQVPNIIKAAAGNYGSGDLSVRGEGGTNEQAIKSGLINSVLGLAPDILLPAIGKSIRNRILPKVFKAPGVAAKDVAEELDDATISASAESAIEATRPRPIPVKKDIPVDDVIGGVEDVPVKVRTSEPKPLIQEVPNKDATFPTTDSLVSRRVEDIRQAEAFDANKVSRPDQRAIDRFEGVTPRQPEAPFRLDEATAKTAQNKVIDDYAAMLRDVGEGNGVAINPETGQRLSNNYRPGMGGGKVTKAQWREEAARQLSEGNADPALQKAFDDAVNPEVQATLAKGDLGPEAPQGSPITVKDVKSIGVTDKTVMPTNLPETPGSVRVTTSAEPVKVKSEVVAQTPASLPKETQNILDNPKNFTKRQVAAARNQRKLARQMAKVQEDTAAAMERVQTASPAAQSGEGFVPTGELGKSVNGGPIEKVRRSTELQQAVKETAQMSPEDVVQTARENQRATGGFTRRDIRNIQALNETRRVQRGTPLWNEMKQILKEDGTIWGQTGALRNTTMRRTATANELISRYESKIYRLADDPTKIDSKLFDQVEAAQERFTSARDNALAAYNEFTRDPSSINAKAYHAAQDAAEKADKAAKQVEYTVAEKALRGNKDIKQVRELQKMSQEAGLYKMDHVDASMLSGTGTFARNFINAATGSLEEGLFGRQGAWLGRKVTGENVGGGVGKGFIGGLKQGIDNLKSAAVVRAKDARLNPLEHIKNWATTGNEIGDTVMDAQAVKNTLDHYTNMLKGQGYSGRELADRASVMARQDPEGVMRAYSGAARVAAGLGEGITKGNKIETLVKDVVSNAISVNKPAQWSENVGKLVARMTVGFPTAIGRSTVEGAKRFTLGAPTFIKAIMEADPLKRGILIKEGVKQAGTGAAVIPPMFYALGAHDMISGAYPDDKETRAQWEREGKTENSIKIGGAWYQLPAYLGGWALPGIFYANLGRNHGDWKAAAADMAKIIPNLLPTDQASNWTDVINGRSDLGKFMSQTGSAAVRAATPAGALLNEVAKAFDPTKNDTSSGSVLENFMDKVLSGIPGANNMANIPDKLADTRDPISNPNPLELLVGAASNVQDNGVKRSQDINDNINSSVAGLDKYGLLNDKNLDGVLEGTSLEALNKLKSGKQLDEGDIKALKEGLVKGVSQTGTDTAYLEREQYDTNLAVLKLKRDLMKEDPTVKPSSLKDLDVAITRGEVYKANKIPYKVIKDYMDTSVTEWRKMGDPEDSDYNPDMYEKLWKIDQLMTKSKVSDNYKGDMAKNKYSTKEYKGRRGRKGYGSRGGGRGSRNIDTSFGTLKTPSYAPKAKQYATIAAQSGGVPRIAVKRPNIVHRITTG